MARVTDGNELGRERRVAIEARLDPVVGSRKPFADCSARFG
jgi:hypothetical protein